MLILTTFLFSCVVHAEAHFQDLRLWRRAQVVASGKQVFSLQSSYENIGDRFTSEGRSQALGDRYGRTLTWSQMLKNQGSARANVEEFMRENGIQGGDVAATSSYEVNQQELGMGANWVYGLTPTWMIGVQVPVNYRITKVRQHITMSPSLTQGARVTALADKGDRGLRDHVRQLAQNDLGESGYDPVAGEKRGWDVGDISLLSQTELARNYHWTWSAQEILRFPTAPSARLSEYIPNAEEDGPLAVGASSLLDYRFRGGVSGVRVGYLAQLPDEVRARSGDSNQIDYSVKRDLGDWIWMSADAEYRVAPKVDLSVEYSYWAKGRDHYTGQEFSAADYDRLAEDSEQRIHQTRVGLLFHLDRAERIMGRWAAALDYSYPWIGENAVNAAKTSLSVTNYF